MFCGRLASKRGHDVAADDQRAHSGIVDIGVAERDQQMEVWWRALLQELQCDAPVILFLQGQLCQQQPRG
eukprot:10727925-Prorocentrum_lima.AAC.1